MIKKAVLFLLFLFPASLLADTSDILQAKRYLEKAQRLIDSLDYVEAIRVADQAIAIYKQFGNDYYPLGFAYTIKGDAYLEKGNYDMASTYFFSAQDILSRHFGEKHPEVAQSFNNIGLSFLSQGVIDSAEQNFQKGLDIRLQLFGEAHPKVADSYNNLGNCALNQGMAAEAYDYYIKALTIRLELLGPEHLDVASSYNNLGHCYLEVGDYSKAIEHFSKSLKIREKVLGANHPKIVQNYLSLGNCHSKLEQLDQVLIYLNRALNLTIQNNQSSHPNTAEIYNQLGTCYSKFGNKARALNFFEKALQIQSKHFKPNSLPLFAVYNNLATTFNEQGDYNKAMLYYRNNLHILRENLGETHPYLADTHNNMGTALAKMGKYEEALDNHYQALNIYASLKNLHRSAETYNNIGNRHWERKNYQAAIQAYRRSLVIFEALHGMNYTGNALIYNNLANCLEKEKNYALTKQYYRKAIDLIRKQYGNQHPLLVEYKTNLAIIHQEEGHFEAAIRQLDEALNILKVDIRDKNDLEFIEYPIQVLDLLNAKARTLTAFFEKEKKKLYLTESLAIYDYAIEVIKILRKQYQEEQSKRVLGEISYKTFEGAIKTCYELFQQQPEKALLEKAFAYSEQSRSSIVLAALNTGSAAYFAGIPDSLVDRELELKTTITFYEKKRREESRKAANASPQLLDSYNNKIFNQKQTYNQLIQQFERDYPDYYRLKYATTTIKTEEIQQSLLENDAALVEYFVADSSIFAFVINKEEVHFRAVPIDSLLEKVSLFRTGIYRPYTDVNTQSEANYLRFLNQYTQTAHFLYKKLIYPIADKLPQKVRIISGGVLNFLPFEALLASLPAATQRLKKLDYLLNHYEFSYGYSATLLQQIKKDGRENFSRGFVAFAPEFKANDRRNLRPLQHNIPEIKTLQALLGGETFVGRAATRQRFIELVGAYQIVHLATHGKSDASFGDYSYLAFTASADSTEGDLLYAKDIYNLPLYADMVVLSACETGQGEFLKGEGVVSLARAFFYAGAKSIVTTLWSIDDASTRKLIHLFYQNINKGLSKSAALRQAKIQYVEEESRPHPFYWAAFITIGDMEAIAFNSSLKNYTKIIFLFFIILFLIFGVHWHLKQKQSS